MARGMAYIVNLSSIAIKNELFGRNVYAFGGTMLTGGAGFMEGTLVGVLILGLIQTIITFQGN